MKYKSTDRQQDNTQRSLVNYLFAAFQQNCNKPTKAAMRAAYYQQPSLHKAPKV